MERCGRDRVQGCSSDPIVMTRESVERDGERKRETWSQRCPLSSLFVVLTQPSKDFTGFSVTPTALLCARVPTVSVLISVLPSGGPSCLQEELIETVMSEPVNHVCCTFACCTEALWIARVTAGDVTCSKVMM